MATWQEAIAHIKTNPRHAAGITTDNGHYTYVINKHDSQIHRELMDGTPRTRPEQPTQDMRESNEWDLLEPF